MNAARGAALATLAALLLLGPRAFGELYTVGSTIDRFSATDQHGKSHTVDESVRTLVVTRDMEGGAILRDALAADGATTLARAGALYVADVSGMPAIVRRLFAVPKLRQRDYPILLDSDGTIIPRLPSEAGRATVIRLDRLRVASIDHTSSVDGLLSALWAAAKPGETPGKP